MISEVRIFENLYCGFSSEVRRNWWRFFLYVLSHLPSYLVNVDPYYLLILATGMINTDMIHPENGSIF